MILETRGLEFSYSDGTKALRGVDIKLERGKKIAFVGPNGSGKSTLFLLLNGTLRPTGGEVILRGKPLKYDSTTLREARKTVGIVFQNSEDQLFAPTVYQDVAFGPTNLGFTEDEISIQVNRTLEYAGINDLRNKPPHHLSGGQKKRAAICGVIVMDPEVMILDEPTSNLDPVGAEEILDLLDELNDIGKTIIVSTHDVDLAYQWSDYVYLLVNGKVIGHGKPDEIFADAVLLKESGLGHPRLMEIYDEMARRELAIEGKKPKSVPELVNLLKLPDLMWMKVPPGAEEGKILDKEIPDGSNGAGDIHYRSKRVKVLHLHDDGRAIVGTLDQTISAGCIIIYGTDQHENEDLARFMAEHEIKFVGAMGTKSRAFAKDHDISLDITSNVIDKSILMALCGNCCLILTNGGMVRHAAKRIRDYSKQSGIDIRVITG
jgi:cobalt/nickel transport system ATP-binding protein